MPAYHKHYALDENERIVWYYDKKARDAFISADPRRTILTVSARKSMHIAQRRALNELAQAEDRYTL